MDDDALIEGLNSRFAGLAREGVDELVVRVAQYAITGGVHVPSQWQAIVRFSNRSKAWGVHVASSPGEAVLGAFLAVPPLPPTQEQPALSGPLLPRTRTRTRTRT